MLEEFKNKKNTTETTKKISYVYGQSIITDHQSPQLVFKVSFWLLRDELRLEHSSNFDQDARKEFVDYNLYKSI